MPVSQPVTAGATKLPAPLTQNEKNWTITLLVLGALVVAATLIWFGASTGGKLLTKESTTTGAGADQKVETKEYGDTILLAALGLGGTFLLAGAFYGRIREIKLPGGGGIVVGDIPDAEKAVVEKKIEESTDKTTDDNEQKVIVRDLAMRLAHNQYARDTAASPVPVTPTGYLEQLGDVSVKEARQLLRLS